jgi:hypothetical protein
MATYDITKIKPEKFFDGYGLSDKKIRSQVEIAIKNTAKGARGDMARIVARTFGVSQKTIKERVFSKKSKRYTLSAYVVMYPKPMNLARFKAKQNKRGKFPIVVKRTGAGRLSIKVVIRPYFEAAVDKVNGRGLTTRFIKELNKRRRAVQFKAGR